jgi:hypothetical protein
MEPQKVAEALHGAIAKPATLASMPDSSNRSKPCDACGGIELHELYCTIWKTKMLIKFRAALYDGNDGLCKFGLPKKYVKANEGDYVPPLACNWSESTFVSGTEGCGKTHFCAVLFKRGMLRTYDPAHRSVSAVWTSVPRLLMELRDTFGKRSGATEADIVQKHLSPEVLVLDDFGAEHVKDWSLSALYLILSDRVNAELQTIVSSNLSLEEIHGYDPRIASRLAGFQIIGPKELGGVDRRIRRAREAGED